MNFTDEQKEQIESNLDKIVAYIKESVQPFIPEDECIEVRFNADNNCHVNKLRVSNYDIEGFVGASYLHFDKGEKKYPCECVYKHTDWMLTFVLGWATIKFELADELCKKLDKRNNIISAIENFEV